MPGDAVEGLAKSGPDRDHLRRRATACINQVFLVV